MESESDRWTFRHAASSVLFCDCRSVSLELYDSELLQRTVLLLPTPTSKLTSIQFSVRPSTERGHHITERSTQLPLIPLGDDPIPKDVGFGDSSVRKGLTVRNQPMYLGV